MAWWTAAVVDEPWYVCQLQPKLCLIRAQLCLLLSAQARRSLEFVYF